MSLGRPKGAMVDLAVRGDSERTEFNILCSIPPVDSYHGIVGVVRCILV